MSRRPWVLVAYVLYGCFRVWHFTTASMFAQSSFGHENFGKVYGLGVNTANVLAACVQYPLMRLSLDLGSYAAVNCGQGYRPILTNQTALVAVIERDVEIFVDGKIN